MRRRSLTIALVNDPADLDLPGVRARLRRADILVFPELMEGGYEALKRGERPRRRDAAVIRRLRSLSRDTVPVCVAGTLYYRDGTRRPTNTTLILARGRVCARYDKMHLFPPAGEDRYFQRGDRFCLFSLAPAGLRLTGGVMICFDLRFPELARALAARGAQVLFVPARWPAVRNDAWRTLLKARAIENQFFVVGCNARGREGGRSYVFDPLGSELFASRGSVPVELVRLDLRRIAAARRSFNAVASAVLQIGRKRSGQDRRAGYSRP